MAKKPENAEVKNETVTENTAPTDTTAAAGTEAGGVPTSNLEGEAGAAERKRAAPSNFLPIVRGRLPLIFVHAIRFDEVISKMSNKDLAAKFSTSVGKVFDIKKGRNFGYVTEAFKPTAEDIQAAKDWAASIGQANAHELTAAGDKAFVDQVTKAYEDRGLASAEEAAAFSALRGEGRAKKEAPAAPAGGAPAAAPQGAADLLS